MAHRKVLMNGCRTHELILPATHFLPGQAKGQFKKQSVANGVEISVPVPSDADSPRFKTSVGSAKYVPEKNIVIWSIKSFPVSTGEGQGWRGTCPNCFCPWGVIKLRQ